MKRLMVPLVLLCLAAPTLGQARCWDSDWQGRRPYGDYCDGPNRGWYGAKRAVETAGEAKKILQDYYADAAVKIGKISEVRYYFEAEILGRDNQVVDKVIVDRRTGRIRSIY